MEVTRIESPSIHRGPRALAHSLGIRRKNQNLEIENRRLCILRLDQEHHLLFGPIEILNFDPYPSLFLRFKEEQVVSQASLMIELFHCLILPD